ncbi:STXBP/UNC-18/SEC1 syntaxin involved in golgi transport [Cryptosporidium ryanae]|uniref:STXBP/UNC-18/SEC1 syntaxin involved in golgi transport n=1 Tax=Cryptosporidium ryanae TaxID=515981 RepID=UPI00351A62E1|nr:STXBP/UNC-18/SEC1 syntaxin involved in golgi transport [Cryptosporidium ryanae]
MGLLDICRKIILDDIIAPVRAISSSTNDGYLIMIVDDFTLKIISSCCSFYDVIEAGVTIIEKLNAKRQPLKKMDCIYFITSSFENLESLMNDFDNSEGMYRMAHLFITSLKDNKEKCYDILTKNLNLLKRLRSFKEVNLDFIPYDSRTFYVDCEGTLTSCLDISRKIEQQIYYGINTFCKTIGIKGKPLIRYHNNGKSEVNLICKNLAEKLNFSFSSFGEGNNECTILLLDRSFDTAPLYIHDYCYQALAYDLLHIPVSINNIKSHELGMGSSYTNNDGSSSKQDDVYEYEILNTIGIKEKKKVILDEKDSKWVMYRHGHIGTVNQQISEETLKFTHNNITAKIHRNNDVNLTTNETIQAVRNIPKYQQTLSTYWTHISIISECFNILKSDDIISLGEVEQCIATLIDSEGKIMNSIKIKNNLLSILELSSMESESQYNIYIDVESKLNDHNKNKVIIKNKYDKLRLVLLYISQFYGISNDDLNQLINLGKFSSDEQIVIKKLLGLGLCNSFEDIASGNGKHTHRYELYNKERIKYFKQRIRSIELDLSRFEPLIKTISYYLMCNLNISNNSLISYNIYNENNFQNEYPFTSSNTCTPHNNYSLFNADNINVTQSFSLSKYSSKDKCIIIFIIGSITFPEIRCIYELHSESKVNIYLGGINITTPFQLIKQVLAS